MSEHKPIPVDRVDWFRVLSDLRRAGMALPLIASLTRCSKTKLLGLRNAEAEPKHATGERIIALWMRQTELPRERLPMQSSTYSRERVEVRRWDGGKKTCPMCGREHGPVPEKTVAESKKARTGDALTIPLFGREPAPH